MREIKFRVWNKTDNALWQEPQLRVLHDGTLLNDTFKVDDVIYMQYTGLKDKNGVEIYEGDIVQTYGNETYKMDIMVIKYTHHGFVMTDLDDEEGEGGLWYYIAEVIGNIYEAPGLLNSDQLRANTEPAVSKPKGGSK